jgi:hypothetical protein
MDVVVVGEVVDIVCKGWTITWVPVLVDIDEPCLLAVSPSTPPPADLARGDLVWIRGRLHTERTQGARHGLPYLVARHFERLRRRAPKGVTPSAQAT